MNIVLINIRALGMGENPLYPPPPSTHAIADTRDSA